MRLSPLAAGAACLSFLFGCAAVDPQQQKVGSESAALNSLQYTAAGLLAANSKPLVIGHEGAGENFGTIPGKPINDTIDSVRLAYEQGASLVEVDVEITKDGQPVTYHDFDFLQDGSCINSYTLADLQTKVPYIPTLEAVLNQAKQFNRKSTGHMSGLLMIELKTPSPLCDPGDSSEVALVSTVVGTIRKLGMESAVMLDGFSPALLAIAQQLAPEIPRELDLDGLQLLTPDQAAAATGMPVTVIQKSDGLGLRWADVGYVYRLPGYDSVEEFIGIALYLQARIVGFEYDFIGPASQQPGAIPQLLGTLNYLGLKAFADPAHDAQTFGFYAGLGFDGAYTDDIPGSLLLQPPL
jgi:glycerophosphoryl diester phosphodiesterase